jgi:hypothetical protein
LPGLDEHRQFTLAGGFSPLVAHGTRSGVLCTGLEPPPGDAKPRALYLDQSGAQLASWPVEPLQLAPPPQGRFVVLRARTQDGLNLSIVELPVPPESDAGMER